jgi:hypothetical protein
MSYYLHERANFSTKHSITLNGNIAIVKRLVDPVFTIKLDVSDNFLLLKPHHTSIAMQPYHNKAIAFAKSNVLTK